MAQCPSAPFPNRVDVDPTLTAGFGETTNLVAVTDYAGVYGLHPTFVAAFSSTPGFPTITNPYGAITNNVATGDDGHSTQVKLTDITDGTSNTILAAESAGRPYLFQAGNRVTYNIAQDGVNGGGWSRPASEIWIIGFTDKTGTTPIGPVTVNAANGLDTTGAYPLAAVPNTAFPLNTDGSGQIYAFHDGGANIVLADGSVRLITPTIAPAVIAALVTRANNDIVPPY